MGKLLSWVLLALLAWGAYRFFLLLKRRAEAARAQNDAAPQGGPQRIVSCDRCGVHVPETEAIAEGDRHYCCEAHRDEARRGH